MTENDNTITDLTTGEVSNYMYGQDVAEGGVEVDDTVNIPRNEYEDLLYESEFLSFLEETVGPEVWENASAMFEDSFEDDEEGTRD